MIRTALHLTAPRPPVAVHGVRLLPAPRSLQPVPLSSVATPLQPSLAPAPMVTANPAGETTALGTEDTRLRILLHDSVRTYQPEVISVRGTLPTLILPAGVQADYTVADLVQYGALLMRPNHTALLIDSVFVSANAKLTITAGPHLRALYLDSTTSGFASIVSWGGGLAFRGAAGHPLTIMGWDHQLKKPAIDVGGGRSYIRAVGGAMELTDVRAANLGFWSGRTGGVAWTGVTSKLSTGGATGSTFTDDTYGAFVARSTRMRFSDDLFEFNQLDGMHVHRYTVGTLVTRSSAVRNGGNGFVVDRATFRTILQDDVSQHNRGDGFLIDGRPLVGGASASGSAVESGSGTRLEDSSAIGNVKTGILLEGGSGTVLRSDDVCEPVTGIAVRYGATDTVVTGSDVGCRGRTALAIGPDAPGTTISGDTVTNARIGVLVRSSPAVQIYSNVIDAARVFGITVRGETSRVSGQDNVISGTGFRAIDARADARVPRLLGSNTTGWVHHVNINALSYLQFHPLAALWLCLLILVLGGALGSRLRRLPAHPYAASTRWRPAANAAAANAAAANAGAPSEARASDPLPAAAELMFAGPVRNGFAHEPDHDESSGHPRAVVARPSRDSDDRGRPAAAARPPRDPAEPIWATLGSKLPYDHADPGPPTIAEPPYYRDDPAPAALPRYVQAESAPQHDADPSLAAGLGRHRAASVLEVLAPDLTVRQDPSNDPRDLDGADPTDQVGATRPLPRVR